MDRYMLFPSGMGQHQNGSYVLFADAQATIAELIKQIEGLEQGCFIHHVDKDQADATIAALQARVKELCKFRQADHEQLVEVQKYWRESQDEVHELQSQLTQRTAECDALKLVNDTHMKTVMKLSHVVEQRTAERDCARRRVDELEAREVDVVLLREDLEKRTAELEAAKRERDEIIQASIKEPIHEPVTYQALAGARSVAKLAYGELIKMTKRRDDLQAELERVRGERDDMHRAAQGMSNDLTGMGQKYEELRTMVAALPKVEGKIEVHTFKNTNQVVVTYNRGIIIGTLYGLDHAKPVAALYEHRQGMEG